ncbi:MAG: CheR family methyltransferase, partial [Thermomicrobiales bacterium]
HEVLLSDDGHGPQPSIDLLFTSASEVFEENLIAVVLSGNGSDGAAGARQVKNAGGTVVIENPDTAAYPGMPRSLARFDVDIIADRVHIGPILAELVSGTMIIPASIEHSDIHSFLAELRDESGVDFTSYKQSTIERRLHHRMVMTGQATLADYVHYVDTTPQERKLLTNSFLIKVTAFFRDPEFFDHLREHVLPELIRAARDHGSDLRIWSAGCATGEEAYSLAMTVTDLLTDPETDPNVRIFATDLDEEAIAFARLGIYPAGSLANIPPDILQRHFVANGDDYEIRQDLRSMIVFGVHDLGERALFPYTDLILCRNVLIYFTRARQRRALQAFAFSLRTGGYLALGTSENMHPLPEYFENDTSRLMVFRRIGNLSKVPPSPIHDLVPLSHPAPRLSPSSEHLDSLQANPSLPETRTRGVWDAAAMMMAVPFGVIVIDQTDTILFINRKARTLFGIHTTAIGRNLMELVRTFDPNAIRQVIGTALLVAEETTPALLVSKSTGDLRRTLEVACRSFPHSGGGQGHDPLLKVISAIDVTDREHLKRRQAMVETIAQHVAHANEEVLVANQDLASMVSGLRAEHDQLIVSTEEIQVATEEVDTLNDELQATNEELETMNEELRATIEELNTTNDDLESRSIELKRLETDAESARDQLRTILNGVDAAIVVVQEHGSILLENQAHASLFAAARKEPVMVDDRGQPLAEDEYPIQRAAKGKAFVMRCGLETPDGTHWLAAKGSPMPLNDGGIVVVVSMRESDRPTRDQ